MALGPLPACAPLFTRRGRLRRRGGRRGEKLPRGLRRGRCFGGGTQAAELPPERLSVVAPVGRGANPPTPLWLQAGDQRSGPSPREESWPTCRPPWDTGEGGGGTPDPAQGSRAQRLPAEGGREGGRHRFGQPRPAQSAALFRLRRKSSLRVTLRFCPSMARGERRAKASPRPQPFVSAHSSPVSTYPAGEAGSEQRRGGVGAAAQPIAGSRSYGLVG